ncbi:MAG: FolB domain protein [Myxococcaceae bacterium]|nr:FolB domain protein [Myxococcaceae bacterium]
MKRHDVIALEGLVVDCVVGVYPHERDTPQPLRVDLYMELDTRPAAEHQRLRDTVDYAAIAGQITFLLTACRFRMIETAAHALARYLLLPPASGEQRAQIDALKLRLTKSFALSGRAIPSVEVYREAHEFELKTEQSKFGIVDIVFERRSFGIYRLNVEPHGEIPLHVHRQMHESELVLGDGLLCQGKPVAAGTVFHWPHGAAHRYDNPTDRIQTVLCVDTPRFNPADEVEVEGEPADPALFPRQRAWIASQG